MTLANSSALFISKFFLRDSTPALGGFIGHPLDPLPKFLFMDFPHLDSSRLECTDLSTVTHSAWHSRIFGKKNCHSRIIISLVNVTHFLISIKNNFFYHFFKFSLIFFIYFHIFLINLLHYKHISVFVFKISLIFD